jgi:hypothetical protein
MADVAGQLAPVPGDLAAPLAERDQTLAEAAWGVAPAELASLPQRGWRLLAAGKVLALDGPN